MVHKHSEGRADGTVRTIVAPIADGEVDMVINTPSGRDARADGYAIRAATTSLDRPIITTVQQLAVAVLGIEAMRAGPLGVAPLQEHARALDLYARASGGR